MKDFYHILCIEPIATEQEIKAAYRKLSLKFHPDVNVDDAYFEGQFRQVKEAYETLSSISKRVVYDDKLKHFKAGKGSSEWIKKYEDDMKRKFDKELRKKEEEIKVKYQTLAQTTLELNDKARVEREEKKRAEKEVIAKALKAAKNTLIQKESAAATLQRDIEILRSRVTELSISLINIASEDDVTFTYDEDPILIPQVLSELNRIKSKVLIQQRTSFTKAFLHFAKFQQVESSFEKKHPDLAKLIVQGLINSKPFEEINYFFKNKPQLIEKFEARVILYVNSLIN